MITVFIDDFVTAPASALNGDTVVLDYRVADVVRGAVTIRRHVMPHLWVRSFIDKASAALQILAIVQGDGALGLGAGGLRASGMHGVLDGTEKGAASYRLGMALAHLLGQDLLGLREVRHIDPVLAAGDLTLLAGRRRPDLLGFDEHDAWSVIEAKGRTDSPDDDVLSKAKEQAENVNLVRNAGGAMISPSARVASVADLSAVPLHVDFVDPQEPDQRDPRKHRTYGVDERRFVRSYYETMRELEEVSGGLTDDVPGRPDGIRVRGARLPGSTIWLALATDVADAALESEDPIKAVRNAQDEWNGRTTRMRAPIRRVGDSPIDEPSLDPSESRTSIGPDGYMVHIE